MHRIYNINTLFQLIHSYLFMTYLYSFPNQPSTFPTTMSFEMMNYITALNRRIHFQKKEEKNSKFVRIRMSVKRLEDTLKCLKINDR